MSDIVDIEEIKNEENLNENYDSRMNCGLVNEMSGEENYFNFLQNSGENIDNNDKERIMKELDVNKQTKINSLVINTPIEVNPYKITDTFAWPILKKYYEDNAMEEELEIIKLQPGFYFNEQEGCYMDEKYFKNMLPGFPEIYYHTTALYYNGWSEEAINIDNQRYIKLYSFHNFNEEIFKKENRDKLQKAYEANSKIYIESNESNTLKSVNNKRKEIEDYDFNFKSNKK